MPSDGATPAPESVLWDEVLEALRLMVDRPMFDRCFAGRRWLGSEADGRRWRVAVPSALIADVLTTPHCRRPLCRAPAYAGLEAIEVAFEVVEPC